MCACQHTYTIRSLYLDRMRLLRCPQLYTLPCFESAPYDTFWKGCRCVCVKTSRHYCCMSYVITPSFRKNAPSTNRRERRRSSSPQQGLRADSSACTKACSRGRLPLRHTGKPPRRRQVYELLLYFYWYEIALMMMKACMFCRNG